MLLLIFFLGCHHLGMEHGCVTEIGSVFAGKDSEWEFRLVDHWCADEEWEL